MESQCPFSHLEVFLLVVDHMVGPKRVACIDFGGGTRLGTSVDRQ